MVGFDVSACHLDLSVLSPPSSPCPYVPLLIEGWKQRELDKGSGWMDPDIGAAGWMGLGAMGWTEGRGPMVEVLG